MGTHPSRYARAAVFAVAAAASCCSSGPAPSDGGADASHDAAADIALDAPLPSDAGRDSPSRDAYVDGWRNVDGFDARCAVRIAEDPEAVVPSLEERPCAGEPGCRELIFPALPAGASLGINGVANGTRWDPGNERGYVSWFVDDNNAAAWRYVLADSRGVTHGVLSIRFAEFCFAAVGAGDGRFAADIRHIDGLGGGSVGSGLIGDPTSFHHLATISAAEMPGQITQDMPVSAAAIVLNTTGGGQLWYLTPEGDRTRVASGGATTHYVSDIHGTAVFSTEFAAAKFVAVSIGGGALEPLVTPADGSDAFELRTDGVNMVWQQGYDRLDLTRYGRIEIWTAPYTTSSAELAPRRLVESLYSNLHGAFDAYGPAVIDTTSTAARYRVFFLDGSPTREIIAPEERILSPLFAGPEEVGMIVSHADTRRTAGVRFYRYDSLPLAP